MLSARKSVEGPGLDGSFDEIPHHFMDTYDTSKIARLIENRHDRNPGRIQVLEGHFQGIVAVETNSDALGDIENARPDVSQMKRRLDARIGEGELGLLA